MPPMYLLYAPLLAPLNRGVYSWSLASMHTHETVFIIHVKSGFGIAIHMRIGLIQSNSKSKVYAFWKSTFHIPTETGFQKFQFPFLFPRSMQLNSKIPKVRIVGFWEKGFPAEGYGLNAYATSNF